MTAERRQDDTLRDELAELAYQWIAGDDTTQQRSGRRLLDILASHGAPDADSERETPDTLPQWLARRFGRAVAWNDLAEDTRLYWQHEANAVRRAVARGGFKAAPPSDSAGSDTRCPTCAGTGLVDWAPGQQRDSEADQQPCPDCTAGSDTADLSDRAADAIAGLVAEDAELRGSDTVDEPVCTCPRTDGFRIKRRGCPAHAEKDAAYWASRDKPVPTPAPHPCTPNDTAAMTVLRRNENGVPTIWCDPCIAPLVTALNNAGMTTIASCCGHGQRPSTVALADGREVLVLPDYETARRVQTLFPRDAHGEPITASAPEDEQNLEQLAYLLRRPDLSTPGAVVLASEHLAAAGWKSPTEVTALVDAERAKVAGEIERDILAVRRHMCEITGTDPGHPTAQAYDDSARIAVRAATKAAE